MDFKFDSQTDYLYPIKPPSRAAVKLVQGLIEFDLDVKQKICADFGANSGGFTAVLLNAGADLVYAVETGYGILDWGLRNHPKVVAMERTNALHVDLPQEVDFITIDTSWTKQITILPSALNNLKSDGHILTLIKPHYETEPKNLIKGFLPEKYMAQVLSKVDNDIYSLGLRIIRKAISPIVGKSAKNTEYLYLLSRKNKNLI